MMKKFIILLFSFFVFFFTSFSQNNNEIKIVNENMDKKVNTIIEHKKDFLSDKQLDINRIKSIDMQIKMKKTELENTIDYNHKTLLNKEIQELQDELNIITNDSENNYKNKTLKL